MNLDYDPANRIGQTPEPRVLAEGEARGVVPVARAHGFVRLAPTSCRLWPVQDDRTGRVEIVFRRLARREASHDYDEPAPRGASPRAGRLELEELGAVELSRDALLALRQEIDSALDGVARDDPAVESVGRQLLASTRSEIASLQVALTDRLDSIAEKVDATAEKVATVRSALGRDLEELVRMLWPKDRRRR